ncbi:hypothetical protein D3C73_1451390 [compost metagenome]
MQYFDNFTVGGEGGRAAAQHNGIAGLQAQPGRIDRYIRPRFIDDSDDAERYADLLNGETVGPFEGFKGVANRIRQHCDLLQAFGNRINPPDIQRQPV